jgi:hypothetical protein
MPHTEKIKKIVDDIDKINQHLAQCRMCDQKEDHDTLITAETTISTLSHNLTELKEENKEQHKEMVADRIILAEKVEQISGNLNQGMMYIKNLQNGAKIRVGMTTTIVSGIVATVLAALIIYLGTIAFGQVKPHDNHPTDKLLIEISEQLSHTTTQLRKFESKINKIEDEQK